MDAEHYRLRDFLTRIAQPYEWFEAGTPEADRLLAENGLENAELPLVVDGDDIYPAATVERLVDAWIQDGTQAIPLRLRRHRRGAVWPCRRRLCGLGRAVHHRLRSRPGDRVVR